MAAFHLASMTRAAFDRAVVVMIALSSTIAGGASAQGTPRSEYEIKAAYLFTFGRFIEWPPHPDHDESAFTLCVLGADPFGRALDATIADGTLHGRRVAAKRIGAAKDATSCEILFISASEERRVDSIVQSLNRAGVLTVSDIPEFVRHGGMIQFVTAENRIRFEINLASAREAGLTMSSELLKVASAVSTNSSPGSE